MKIIGILHLRIGLQIKNGDIYYSRLVEKEIELKLKTSGAVVVAGPKFCGKTTTCMLYQKSFVKLNTKQGDVSKLL